MKALLSSKNGNFAVTFALSLVPIFGAAGLAVDYTRATNVRASVQNQVDAAALNAVHVGPSGDIDPQVEFLRTAILKDSVSEVEQLKVQADWLSPTDLRMTAKGVIPLTILAAVPGFSDGIPFSVSATARISEPQYIYSPPTVAQLDPDAADYNRIYVYCFDQNKSDNRGNRGRKKMTAIADNAGTQYKYKMPTCDEGQVLSYRLLNVRNARTNSRAWDDKKAEHYEYYTDTVLEDGVEKYNLKQDMLETVLCNDRAECRGRSQGGILPEGAGRTPLRNQKACAPGKFMYFGWEDRPPDSGTSDRDYNDIRIIMSCPTIQAVGERTVRLID